VNVHLAEFPRVWRPGKSMRRVLAACWGTDASVGRPARDPLLRRDGALRQRRRGGTRISHLSHIDKPKSIPLLVSRGKSATFRVQPLADLRRIPSSRINDARRVLLPRDRPRPRRRISGTPSCVSSPPAASAPPSAPTPSATTSTPHKSQPAAAAGASRRPSSTGTSQPQG
jgi:hypothetical protein